MKNKVTFIAILTVFCSLWAHNSFADTSSAPSLISSPDKDNAIKNKQEDENKNLSGNLTVIDIKSDVLKYYDEQNVYVATGNAEIFIKEKNSRLTADKITFDPENNVITAEDNVKVTKDGKLVKGSFARIKLDQENMFFENPTTTVNEIIISAKSAESISKRMVAQKGTLKLKDKDIQVNLKAGGIGAKQVPSLSVEPLKANANPYYRLYSKKIDVKTSDDKTVTILKDSKFKVGKLTVLSIPYFEVDKNKRDQIVETTIPEFGSDPSIGMYFGAGPILHTPYGGTLKLAPALTYGTDSVYRASGTSKLGIGLMGRYQIKGNTTEFGYADKKGRLAIKGEQRLTENAILNYGTYSYIDNGFLGLRRPKYIAEAVHEKEVHNSKKFNIRTRTSAGYAEDMNASSYSTSKMQLQGIIKGNQPLIGYKKYLEIRPIGQYLLALYGSGDTFQLARIGPQVEGHVGPFKYNANYFKSSFNGESPFGFDNYYEGKDNVRLGGEVKISRYLDIGFYRSYNLDSNVASNSLVENQYIFRVGPEDVKVTFAYDNRRKTTMFGLDLLLGAGKTQVEFDKLNAVDTKNKN